MKKIIGIAILTATVSLTSCNDKKSDGLSEKAIDSTEVDNTEVITKDIPAMPEDAETKSVTIKGSVLNIEHGKDGYTAEVKDEDGQIYFVTVSRVNLAEPENYRDVNVGDVVTASGEQWEMDGHIHIKAINIMI